MSMLTEKLGRLFKRGRTKDGLEVGVRADAGDLPVHRMSKREQREATLMQLKQGYEEVTETMKSLRSHMEEQARRSDRLLDLMEGLPDVLRSIPESNQRQTQVLQAMRSQMDTQTQTSERLSTALTELAGATGRQQNALGELHKQMEASRQSGESLRDSLGILSETMETMTDASKSNVDAVNAIAQQTRDNQRHTEDLYRKTQRQTVVMSSVSWALAIVALAVAGYVAVMVTRVAERPVAPAPNVDASRGERASVADTPAPVDTDAAVQPPVDSTQPVQSDEAAPADALAAPDEPMAATQPLPTVDEDEVLYDLLGPVLEPAEVESPAPDAQDQPAPDAAPDQTPDVPAAPPGPATAGAEADDE